MKKAAVILAGGIGRRFWPETRENKPKHLLKITPESNLLQKTCERTRRLFNDEDIYIIVAENTVESAMTSLPWLNPENIIVEPFGKDTLHAIILALSKLNYLFPENELTFIPSDHFIHDEKVWVEDIRSACRYLEEYDGLITIGIKPTYPETSYGYIQIDESGMTEKFFKAMIFAEKPPVSAAQGFILSGDFRWHSGILIAKGNTLFSEIVKYNPEFKDEILQISGSVGEAGFNSKLKHYYSLARKISVDYSVLEKSDKVYVYEGQFLWSDIATWNSIHDFSEKDLHGNAIRGECYLENSSGNFISAGDRFYALIGIEELIIIDSKDSVLICNKKDIQKVNHIVDFLRMNGKSELY